MNLDAHGNIQQSLLLHGNATINRPQTALSGGSSHNTKNLASNKPIGTKKM